MKDSRINAPARAKRELVIQEWNRLRRPAVGERELRAIRRAIAQRFGKDAVESHVSIARWLADDGAELRHPEVIEFDARWRETLIAAGDSAGRRDVIIAKPLTLKQAETLINKLEKLRKKFERA